MNWVLIIVLLLLIWEMMRGYRRGFLRTIYSLVSWLIVLVFVMWATPYIDTYLLEHTSLYERLETYCADEVRQSAERNTEQVSGTGGQTGETGEQNSGTAELAELGLYLPEGVFNDILEKTGEAADEFLESSGVYDQIARGMAGFIVEGISFFLALIAAWILVHFISQFLGLVSKIPIIHGMNKILGIFAGGMYGFILVWIAFYLIALSSTSELGGMLVAYIYQNPFLQFLYENNLVISIILK